MADDPFHHDNPLHDVPIVGELADVVESLVDTAGDIVDDWVPDLDGDAPSGLADHAAALRSGPVDGGHHDANAQLYASLDAGTRGVLDSMSTINAHDATISGAVDTIASGHDLSDAQTAELEHIGRSASAWSNTLGILNQADEIHNSVMADENRRMWEDHDRRELNIAEHESDRAQQIIDEGNYALNHPGAPMTDPKIDPTSTGYVDI